MHVIALMVRSCRRRLLWTDLQQYTNGGWAVNWWDVPRGCRSRADVWLGCLNATRATQVMHSRWASL